MKLIAAVDDKWGIGKDNGLLFRLPLDMKFFRETTLGKTVIMGRKTLQSFPGSKPLPDRRNIVLASRGFSCVGCEIVHSVDELFNLISTVKSDDAFVIGGATVYKTLLPYCDEALITRVYAEGGADAFFENLDENADWKLIEESETLKTNGFDIRFTKYKNSAVKKR